MARVALGAQVSHKFFGQVLSQQLSQPWCAAQVGENVKGLSLSELMSPSPKAAKGSVIGPQLTPPRP